MTETFESWWERVGCRVVGDPEDYARAAWEACARANEKPAHQAIPPCMYGGCPLPSLPGSNFCGAHLSCNRMLELLAEREEGK